MIAMQDTVRAAARGGNDGLGLWVGQQSVGFSDRWLCVLWSKVSGSAMGLGSAERECDIEVARESVTD